jgi:RNA polymerase sigma factor (sigma-70 family)
VDLGPLYLEHRDKLHRVAASILREVGLQEEKGDVVQAAFESLMSSPPTGVIGNWEAYLVTVVKNKAYDRVRAADTRHFGRGFDMQHDDQAEAGVDAFADLEDELDTVREGAYVWDSMGVLDDRERHVVREVVQNVRPQGEVAEELGVSRPRVNQILKRALQKLRDDLARKGMTG